MGLLTIPDALAKYPELVTVANLDGPALVQMIDQELRGHTQIQSIEPDHWVMIYEDSIIEYLNQHFPNSDS